MDEYIGIIKIFAGNFAPKGWAFCQGQTMQINTNQALFAILGTVYGGDGMTTFKLPNYQGLIPVGMGKSPVTGTVYTEGKNGGVTNVALTVANLPQHTHNMVGAVTMQGNSDAADTTDPSNTYPGPAQSSVYAPTGDVPMAPVRNTLAVSPSGAGRPYSNTMPFLGMNYIICISGLFPPRN